MKFIRTNYLRVGVILALLLTLFGYLFRGEIVMMTNPKYSEKNLMGLTLPEVLRRLGAPNDDTGESLYQPPGSKPHQQRAFVYEYAEVGRTIYFIDDKVDGVIWDRK